MIVKSKEEINNYFDKIEIPENSAITKTFLIANITIPDWYIRNDEMQNMIDLLKANINNNIKTDIIMQGVYGAGKTELCRFVYKGLKFVKATKLMNEDRSLIKYTELNQYKKGVRADILYSEYLKSIMENKYYNMNNFVKYPYLIIDDVGTELNNAVNPTAAKNFISRLLLARYEDAPDSKLTIISTNQTSEQLATNYGSRLADRLSTFKKITTFPKKSYRK